ncbi:uncharacterized protein K460DRAFT_83742 [Cucurbitaria berberidis CBS 394.84]|uniref:Uncharacterized protein n=1 Tax=Cucurbitaria berberidis CBS 394.84 TaxID=1168544 RepID=A0A9P4LBU4_9PLEO|nr:uncharacterized protein K460DRAFT_83742 [Cucurbitaria berberidis CBS 394.84]KAF1848978.1 hypothetical protein K460DRAFT_83742 [Cucurbitaria berberidis CBS 394.84]
MQQDRARRTREEVDCSLPPCKLYPSLYIVLEKQADGEPNHWSLFVAHENQKGNQYQVHGDAENMHYLHAQNVGLFSTENYFTSYSIVESVPPATEDLVRDCADSEPPPSAPNRAAVTENCQAWVCRVLTRLAQQGIVKEEKVASARRMVEPIN